MSRCVPPCGFPAAPLSAPGRLCPVVSRCCCSNFVGAARASFSPTVHSRMKSYPHSSLPITGRRGGRAKRGPRGAPLILVNGPFSITGRRGGRAEGEAPEAPPLSLSIILLSVGGRCRYNYLLATSYQLLHITYCSPLTTQYLLFSSSALPANSYYLLLTSVHLRLTTYSLLTTTYCYCLPLTTQLLLCSRYMPPLNSYYSLLTT